MVTEAEANAEIDKKAREMAELKNDSERAVSSTEKMLKDLGDKVSEADKTRIEEKIADLKATIEKQDHEGMATAKAALEEETHKLSEMLYQQSGAAGEAGEEGEKVGAAAGASGDDVIDAEFKEDK